MKIFTTFLLFLSALVLQAQQPIVKKFTLSSGYDGGKEILPTSDGGYVILGRVRVNGKDDIFLQRLDAVGNQRWFKVYGNPSWNENVEKGILPLANGWLIAGTQYVTPNNPVGWLVRVDDNGQELWSKNITLPNLNAIGFADLAPVAWGGFLAVGSAEGKTLAVKLSDNGAVEWHFVGSGGLAKTVVLSESGANAYLMTGKKLTQLRSRC